MKKQYHFAKRVDINVPQADGTTETVEVVAVQQAPRPLLVFIGRVNIARPICSAMLGKEHSTVQRMAVGALVMTVGVGIAKVVGHHDVALVAGLGDAIGYGLHGLGLTPFIEYLAERYAASNKA